MKAVIFGALAALSQAYRVQPFWTTVAGVAIVATVLFGAAWQIRMYFAARARISAGPILFMAALLVAALGLVWAATDGVLIWLDEPVLSQRIVAWLVPEELSEVEVLAAALRIPDGESVRLPGAVTLITGLLVAGFLAIGIAWIATRLLAERLELEMKPDDILRQERRVRLERRKARLRAQAAQAVAQEVADGAGETAAKGAGDGADTGEGKGSGEAGAGDEDAYEDDEDDEDEDEDEDGDGDGDARRPAVPLPDDAFGRLYKLAGHFTSYREVESRFTRWRGPLTVTLMGLVTLGLLPAALGHLPAPLWIAAALFTGGLRQLVSLPRKPKPTAPEDEAPDDAGDDRPERRGAAPVFAERGEISAHLTRAPEPAEPAPAAEPPTAVRAGKLLDDVVTALGIDGLYGHQRAAIATFDAGRSVLLATPPGSGRELFCDALLLYAVLADAERVLYVSRDPAGARAAQERFEARAEATHWKWNILAANLADRAGTIDPTAAQPALIFADPDAVHRELCGQGERWHTFLSSLGAVVVPDIHAYSGVPAAHLTHLFRRLLRGARRARMTARGRKLVATGEPPGRIRFVATAEPGYGNLSRYVERVTGQAVAVIGPDRDDAPRTRVAARIVSPRLSSEGVHPAPWLATLARRMEYSAALDGYVDVLSAAERGPTPPDPDVVITRLSPARYAALPLLSSHLGGDDHGDGHGDAAVDPRRRAAAGSPGATKAARPGRRRRWRSVLWQPDRAPLAELLARSAPPVDHPDLRGGRALIAAPDALGVERGHLRCALAEGELATADIAQAFSREAFSAELTALRASGDLIQRAHRVLAPADGAVESVHALALASSDDVHDALGLATADTPWHMCERATGRIIAELEGGRARAAAYPQRLLVADGRRFTVLPDELQDALDRRRIWCEEADVAALSTPIRTLFIEVVERRRQESSQPQGGGPGASGRGADRGAPLHPGSESGQESVPDPEGGSDRDDAPDARTDGRAERDRRRGSLRSLGGQPFALQLREVVVTETVSGLRRFDLRGDGLDTTLYDQPIVCTYETRAAVMGFPVGQGYASATLDPTAPSPTAPSPTAPSPTAPAASGPTAPGGVLPIETLHALAHGFREALPALLVFREEDLDIAPLARTPTWSTPAVAFVDLHPGGAGFAEAIDLDVIRRLARWTLALIRGCPDRCATGCPACLHTTTCRAPGNHYQSLDKPGAEFLLAALLGERPR